ncbi:ME1 [Symbiodinium natans]|uniref:ME1 protein n=1 Tax=Symbiodinium natans TaxID=878477 RepID=A0A812S9S1_9DINO|nr:ME1 [Symbiodinium natans]
MTLNIDVSGRDLSLPKSVAKLGAAAWNDQEGLSQVRHILDKSCNARTVQEALQEVRGFASLGHNLWAYAYLRMLHHKDSNLFYRTLLAEPAYLMPIVYTPTVGEACQKFGTLPFLPRGCYVSLSDRGNVKAVLKEYAEAHLPKDSTGKPQCQCIVFSDGGRILGLGDLGTWGMGIPIGKLDLYTVCGGFDPHRTIPVMIDAGCSDASGNSAKLTIRDHDLYTGLKQNRVKHTSKQGTEVNTAYYGPDSFIGEFMTAASELFGRSCLLQFEDFNSNDAFPLLEEYRSKFLTYNDDIQGTASVAVAAVLGGIKLNKPLCTDLLPELKGLRFLFHGAGSANLGSASLMLKEAGVPESSVLVTNSKGVIWKSADGKKGTFKNDEQKAVARVGEPKGYDATNLVSIIKNHKPDVLVGAVGRAPGCFTKEVVQEMVQVQAAKGGKFRPIIFALSNPMTQAELTAEDCYTFSDGKAIFGSGTRFAPVTVQGKTRTPGQVNNFFVFPGMSFGAMCCEASHIPDGLFMEAAEAVANSLDKEDVEADSVLPSTGRIREVGHNVAVRVVLAAQKAGIAQKKLGDTAEAVSSEIAAKKWEPEAAGVPKIVMEEESGPSCSACRVA